MQCNVVQGNNEPLIGDSGSDCLVGNNQGNTINGMGGNDDIDGAGGNDSLRGGNGHDTLEDGNGRDTVRGEGGNDTFILGRGNDRLNGGGGQDTLQATFTQDPIWNTAMTRLTSNLGVDRVFGIESYDFDVPGTVVDPIYIDLERIFGFATLVGGGGDDTLISGPNADILNGRIGNDRLIAGDGDDRVRGGDGNDTLTGGLGDDSLQGGLGQDLLKESGDRNFFLKNLSLRGQGVDELRSIESAFLTGGAGDNRLIATKFTGSVTLQGGSGNDELKGSNRADDRLEGGAGDDMLVGQGGSDILVGGAGGDTLNGAGNAANSRGFIDTLQGGVDTNVSNRFILGDQTGVYYDDLNSMSRGVNDYAVITDLHVQTSSTDPTDIVQLKGNASQYLLGASPISGISGTALYFRPSASSLELVAIFSNVSNLNLSAGYFDYVP